MAKTLNLQELFGQRERPKVVGPSGKTYELRLPDEMDPLAQVALSRRGDRLAELYSAVQESDDEQKQEELLEELATAFRDWMALLNPEMAENEPLGFFGMARIVEFYNDAVRLEVTDPTQGA